MNSDTIAAIATAMSPSGIGIVRISGEDTLDIIDRIYHSKDGKKKISKCKSHTIHYGYIYDGDEVVDEVMVLLMKAPNSYTREDTVEIDCHGGVYVMKRILETVIKNGARPAEPGEFTKRAFLNGRIDLTQAESVIDVINAKNDFALKSSLNQLKGSVLVDIKKIREEILHEIAFIESALDDPEHISLDNYPEKLLKIVDNQVYNVDNILKTFDNGRILREGINTVIVGKPNAGKSSLLNILVGQEKAIVTEIAGTTRDVLEEQINLNGITLNVMDTAGIRDTSDVVEKIGVERAKKYAENADLVIYVIDVDMIQNQINKKIISISAKERIGIQELENTIKDMFFQGEVTFNDEVYTINVRQKTSLQITLNHLQQVIQSIKDDMPEDFYSIDLMGAYEELGKIIGESVEDDLVDEIFSKFCMGK